MYGLFRALAVIFLSLSLVREAQARDEWSWPAFAWILVVATTIGGVTVAVGMTFALRLREDHFMLGITLYLAMLFAAVVVIVLISRKINLHYLPSEGTKKVSPPE